jgi:hypothetical protein
MKAGAEIDAIAVITVHDGIPSARIHLQQSPKSTVYRLGLVAAIGDDIVEVKQPSVEMIRQRCAERGSAAGLRKAPDRRNAGNDLPGT